MKTPPKLYKIGEVVRYTDFSRQTIHNYTTMGLIEETERTEAGHRLYPPEVFDRLEKIQILKRHRTLEEVKEILDSDEDEVLSSISETESKGSS